MIHIEALRQITVSFATGLERLVSENLFWIMLFVMLVITSWVIQTSRLVMGKAPDLNGNRNQPGTLDLVLVLLFGSSLVYALIVYPISWIVGPNLDESYLPSIIVFSILSAMVLFEWTEAMEGKYVSTGLEWIPLTVAVYPDRYLLIFLSFPFLLVLGRIERMRKPLRKIAPTLSAIWLTLGFLLGVFHLKALLWLGPLFCVYCRVTLCPFGPRTICVPQYSKGGVKGKR